MRALPLVLLLVAPALALQEGPVLRGRVVDAEGGPVELVRVELGWGAHVLDELTDDDGRFTFGPGPGPGVPNVSLSIQRPGAAPIDRSVPSKQVLRAGGYDYGDLVLGPPGTLVVRVVDAAGTLQREATVECAPVPAGGVRGKVHEQPVDRTTGEARLSDLAAGRYWVSARLGRLDADSRTVDVEPGFETVVEVRLAGLTTPALALDLDTGGFAGALHREQLTVRDEHGREAPFELVNSGGRMGSPVKFFLRAPPGVHYLEVDHPRFLGPARTLIEDGCRIELVPRGAAELDLHVPDVAEARTLTVRLFGLSEPGIVKVCAGEPVDLSNPRRLAIPPGLWMAEVEVAPWPQRWVPLLVNPGEVTRTPVHVGPARDAEVVLSTGPDRADPAEATISSMRGPAWFPGRRVQTHALEGDRITLENLVPEPYRLRLQWGLWAWKDYVIEGGAPPTSIEMPRTGRVEGRLELEEGFDLRRLTLRLVGNTASVPVEQGGRFVLPLVLDGALPYELFLDRTRRVGTGSIEVLAGETSRPVIDLRSVLTGPMSVDVREGDWPLRYADLYLASEAGEVLKRPTDIQGRVFLDEVPEGRYRASVRMPNGIWAWTATQVIEVEAASARTVRLDFSLLERNVRFQDGSGEPLRLRRVAFETGTPPVHSTVYRRTDSDGELRLELPIGPVRFFLPDQDRFHDALRPWVAQDGPLVITFPKRSD